MTMNIFLVDQDEFEGDTLEEHNYEEIDIVSSNSNSCDEKDKTSSNEDNYSVKYSTSLVNFVYHVLSFVSYNFTFIFYIVSSATSAHPNGSRGSSESSTDRLDPKEKRIPEKSWRITVEKELQRLKASKLTVMWDEKWGKPIC
ncbi:hypothetical protein TorRG33x02_354020 [Trema orientale]|uniref:Uncharacterized protein n=1 Tax=Trema orientale TaxID=63057 RepID=A0A2P5ABT2_TREOI|nr:hypothetical protein TorRG33x02_354020 [Trema orientale]